MSSSKRPIRVRKLKEEDKKLLGWLKKGGREGAKTDLKELIKRASKPSKP